MSENYKLYARKMAEQRAGRQATSAPLQAQLDELYRTVLWCEGIWNLEDWIEGSR